MYRTEQDALNELVKGQTKLIEEQQKTNILLQEIIDLTAIQIQIGGNADDNKQESTGVLRPSERKGSTSSGPKRSTKTNSS